MLLLWGRLMLLGGWLMLLLRGRLMLFLRSRLMLLLLLGSLMLLLLLGCLMLLLLLGCLMLLLLLGSLMLLLLLSCLAFLLLDRLMLLLLLGGLMLLLLLSRLMFLLLRSLVLLLLLGCLLLLSGLVLLLLLGGLVLLLLRLHLGRFALPLLLLHLGRLALLLLLERWRLALYVFWGSLVARLHLGRHLDVAVCRERLADDHARRTAMVLAGKLSPVGTGSVFILQLRPHRGGMLFAVSDKLLWSGADLQSARAAIVTHTNAAPVLVAHRALIDVVNHSDVDIVVRTVVVEMAAAPVATLVAEADVAKAIVDAAIVADVGTPVATVKAVAVVVEAPVAGGPESALVGSLNPSAGYPVIATLAPCPVAGRPEIAIAGGGRLVVVGDGRRRLIGVFDRLCAVAGIVPLVITLAGFLLLRLCVVAARVGLRSALLGRIIGLRPAGVGCGVGLGRRVAGISCCRVGRCGVRCLILCDGLVARGRHLVLTLGTSGHAER